jgi:phenylpropionate dioxygenase-like ring-hydroxylating dioxygenase large terminal subunit
MRVSLDTKSHYYVRYLMKRSLELDVADKVLALLERPSMALVDEVSELPVDTYTNLDMWEREKARVFSDLPLLAALSGELPNPGDWKLFDAAGPPIVVVRGDDGVVRGFLNSCRHRGAPVVEEARGCVRTFTCPYHSWVYNRQGELMGMPHPRTFDIDKADRGLFQVSVEEVAGAIWVVPKSDGKPFDVWKHLGPLGEELASWNLDSFHFVEQREHRIRANWKLAMDTFTEAYHIGNLHKNTIGAFAIGGLNITTQYGEHFRQVLAMKPIRDLVGTPRDEWEPFLSGGVAFVYILFPNTTLLFFGDHAEVFQVFPGETADTSVTLQTMFSYTPVETEDQREQLDMTFDLFHTIVGTEDYRMSTGIQRGFVGSKEETFLLGKCEAITHAMHQRYAALRDDLPGTPWAPSSATDPVELHSGYMDEVAAHGESSGAPE